MKNAHRTVGAVNAGFFGAWVYQPSQQPLPMYSRICSKVKELVIRQVTELLKHIHVRLDWERKNDVRHGQLR